MCRIIHLIPHDGIGGVEAAARSMAVADTLECDFTLLLIAGTPLATVTHRIVASPFRSANNPLAHLRALIDILQRKPDVLVCSLWRSVFVGLLVKLLRPRTRVVCFLHSGSSKHLVDRVMNSLMMRYSDAVWADSAATLRARYRNGYNKQNEIISFVLSGSSTLTPRYQCAPKFVFWGRLHKVKGIDRAIEFIAEMVKHGRDTRFEIWGPDAGEKKNLISLVRARGLENHVRFMGLAEQKKLVQIAGNSDFYLQLSHAEGMAISVVEAMQFGLVPIVTAVGEIATYCCAGKNAIIVDDPYNPGPAIETLLKVLKNKTEYRQLQVAAQGFWGNTQLYKDSFCAAAKRLLLRSSEN